MRAPVAPSFVERGVHQPVQWESLSAALAAPDGRSILVLCGSRLSHACHVLDEQLDDEARARALSRFRAVRVDADVQPDVDLALQTLARQRTPRWPLWALLSPTGTPLAVSAYLDPSDSRLDGVWAPLAVVWDEANRKEHRQALDRRRDPRLGGFLPTPKLLPWAALEFLHDSDRAFVERTLTAVAGGGLFDPLGGGVHAASVDERWVVPLYEKRACDQAAALDGLGWALRDFADPRLRTLQDEVVDFCLDRLRLDDGTFASGVDADSGPYDHAGFYTFTEAEARHAVAPESWPVAQRYFDLYGRGELPSNPTRNVLYAAATPGALAIELGITQDEVERHIAAARAGLAAAQARRSHPPVDAVMAIDGTASLARALLGCQDTRRSAEAESAGLCALDRLYALVDDAGGGPLHHRSDRQGTVDWLADLIALGRAALAAFAITGEAHHLGSATAIFGKLDRWVRPDEGLSALPFVASAWALPFVAGPLRDATSPSLVAECVRFCRHMGTHVSGAADLAEWLIERYQGRAAALGVEGCGLLLG